MVFIGLKYCGGCASRFDRVALVAQLRESLSKKALFTSYEDEKAKLILIVCGCESACVNTDQFEEKEIFRIFKPEHSKAFKEKIRSMEQAD